ncbi:MAG: hypothetical protein HY042_10960 [Spirochaetia bacterium]|nr:hypothetical protein [Spirochaetia bacterium]
MKSLLTIHGTTLVLALAAVVALGTGCASVDLSQYPRDERTIFVQNLSNIALQADANVELTEALKSELSRRNNFVVMDEKPGAALWVTGEVAVYRKETRMYDNYRNPIRFELIIGMTLRVRSNPASAATHRIDTPSLEVSANVEFSTSEGFVEAEEGARRRLLRILASRAARLVEDEFAAVYSTPGSK